MPVGPSENSMKYPDEGDGTRDTPRCPPSVQLGLLFLVVVAAAFGWFSGGIPETGAASQGTWDTLGELSLEALALPPELEPDEEPEPKPGHGLELAHATTTPKPTMTRMMMAPGRSSPTAVAVQHGRPADNFIAPTFNASKVGIPKQLPWSYRTELERSPIRL